MSEANHVEEWITVAEAAARFKVSERSIQRRCRAGKIAARLTARPTGQQWEIEAAKLPESDDTRSRDTNDTNDRGHDTDINARYLI